MTAAEKRDPLREAIRQTFAATAGTRERAQELLDDVARRSREAVSGPTSRLTDALEGMRLTTRDELRSVERQLAELNRRVAKLESQQGETKAKP